MESVRMKMDDQKKHDYSELVERLEDRATCMEVLSPDFAAACRDAAAAIAKLAVERDELHTYAFEATKTITSMTVGGSEFFGKRIGEMYTADLPYCVEHIMDRERRAHERWLREWERNGKLSVQLEKAEAEVERLTKERDSWKESAAGWQKIANPQGEAFQTKASAAVKVKDAFIELVAELRKTGPTRNPMCHRDVLADEIEAILSALTTEPAAPQDGNLPEGWHEAALSSLLARIHRDGGHYEAKHGTRKAVCDADEIVARIYAEQSAAPQEAEAVGSMYGDFTPISVDASTRASAAQAVTEAMVEAATKELLAHGEFSSTPGNNEPNARIAARAALTAAQEAGR